MRIEHLQDELRQQPLGTWNDKSDLYVQVPDGPVLEVESLTLRGEKPHFIPDKGQDIVLQLKTPEAPERAALLALVRFLGAQDLAEKGWLPVHLHDQVRQALGDDFYKVVDLDDGDS